MCDENHLPTLQGIAASGKAWIGEVDGLDDALHAIPLYEAMERDTQQRLGGCACQRLLHQGLLDRQRESLDSEEAADRAKRIKGSATVIAGQLDLLAKLGAADELKQFGKRIELMLGQTDQDRW